MLPLAYVNYCARRSLLLTKKKKVTELTQNFPSHCVRADRRGYRSAIFGLDWRIAKEPVMQDFGFVYASVMCVSVESRVIQRSAHQPASCWDAC